MKNKNVKKKFILIFLLIISFNSIYCQNDDNKKDTVILKGTVIDNEGNPIAGINVIESGKNKATVTDIDGKFKLLTYKGDSIKISSCNYLNKSYIFDKGDNIRINPESGLIVFCCSNHNPSHCAAKPEEMKKLTQEKNCSFK